MTTNDAFERNLSVWLHEDAEHRVPDHLAEVLQRTAATRQRPAWSSLERWLPVDTTFRRSVFARPVPMRAMAILLLIGLLIGTVIALTIGTPTRLPEPFGLAANGWIVTSRDGDIYLLDRTNDAPRLVVGGDGFDFSPIFSRDGTRMTFLRSDGPIAEPAILTLYVAKADGSEARAVTPPTESLDWFDWSPDGTRIAYMARGALYVIDVDAGGEPRRLGVPEPVHFPTWLPPDGKEIVYRREAGSPAIFAVDPEGVNAPRRLSKTIPINPFDFQGIAASPDGSHISFTRWSAAGIPRVFALDVASGTEVPFPLEAGVGQEGSVVYSPDGSLVAYARTYGTGFEIVVANADGTGNERPIGPRRSDPVEGATWAFTPDGTALAVRYGTDDKGATQLLPLDGSPATELGSGGFEFVDVQRVAP